MTNPNSPVERTVDTLTDRAKSYVDAGVNALHTTADKAREITTRADGYVHQNPWLVIGIAAGVGALAGFLLRGRTRH